MALEAISNTNYHEAAKVHERTKVELSSGAMDLATINIVETPNTVVGDKGNVQKEQHVSDQQIKDTVSQVNNKLKMHRTKCEFSYHEETKRVSIKVLDKETDEIIREIPPEQTLEMIEKAWELAGFLVDERR